MRYTHSMEQADPNNSMAMYPLSCYDSLAILLLLKLDGEGEKVKGR
jgi:hypothetical protein